jgi:hypothetical protein
MCFACFDERRTFGYDYSATLSWTSIRVSVFRDRRDRRDGLRRLATKGRKGSRVGFHPDTLHILG